ncbi:MAG TPA: alanine--tRNA ligase-related protein [Candidatus Dormibacteraeota bacterium]|nr:alanine--tRNA ligase-related protein [Candidatus Dormibacteraeota bacterium]
MLRTAWGQSLQVVLYRATLRLQMTTQRIYYDDSFQSHFDAQVVSCGPGASVPSATGSATWEVVLDLTAFYPTSGGQPHDTGSIADARVVDVRDAGEDIIHVVDKPLSVGAAAASIDWPRRFDHMQQHTGQHLLSAIFQERFGLATVSFHLGAEISTIDLRGPEPSQSILDDAALAVNGVIFENRPITVRYGTAEQLAAIGVRKKVERAGILRAIEIAGADLQPCGGTHVRHTGQIGILLLRGVGKVRQDWRVEFVCGGRAARFARADFQTLRQLGGRLEVPPEEAAAALERVFSERDTHYKNLRAALTRLAQAEAAVALSSTQPLNDGTKVIAMVIEESHPEYVSAIASVFTKTEKTIALLVRRESGDIILAQNPSAKRDMTMLLRQLFGKIPGKGGGTKDFVRGKLADASQAADAIDTARSLLTE